MSSVPATSETASPELVATRVDTLVNDRLASVAGALWRAELLRAILQLATACTIGLVLWAVVDQWVYSAGLLGRSVVFTASLVAILGVVVGQIVPLWRSQIRPEYAARSLERDIPELRQALLSYVTLRGAASEGLSASMVRSLGAQTASRIRSFDRLPTEATGTFAWWLAAIASVVLLLAYSALSPKDTLQSARRLVAPLASIAAPQRVTIIDVRPGDAETLAGHRVEVSAQVRGLRDDETPLLRWHAIAGEPQEELLSFDAETRRYRGSIAVGHTVSGDVQYEVIAGDANAGPYRLHVQDIPVLVRQTVHYQPPAYTGEKPYSRSGGAISALAGTMVKLSATTSRPISRARIEFNPQKLGQSVQATAGSREMQIGENGTDIELSFPLRSPRGRGAAVELENYRIQIWDPSGQPSPDGIVYPIRVIEDLAPEVTIVVPQQTPKDVPIDAQQNIEVHALDPDYGLRSIELEIRRGIDLLANPVLWRREAGATGNQIAEYRFRPSELELRVGDVISVTAVASDNRLFEDDPSIEPNYASTDPIQLKITMGEAPSGEDAANDGLTKKDDRPASDASQGGQEGQSGGSGSGGTSGGKSGKQGESGEEGQSGSGASQGEKSDGGTNQSQGGSGGSNSSGDEAAPTGESPDPADSSDSGSNTGAGSPDPNNQQPNQGDSGDNPSGSEPQASESSGQSSSSQSPSTQSPSSKGQTRDTTPGASPSQDGASPNASEDPSQADAGSPSSGQPSGDGASQPETSSGDRGNGTSESSGRDGKDGSRSSPEHDGEAFERIRDYLDQKEKDQASPNRQTPSDTSAENAPQKQPDSGTGKSGEQRDDRGQSAGSKDQSGEKPAGSDASQGDSSGKPDSGEAAGDQDAKSGGTQQPRKPPQGESQQSGSQPGESQQADAESSGDGKPSSETAHPSASGDQPGDTKPQDDAKSADSQSEGSTESGSSGAGSSSSSQPKNADNSKAGDSSSDAASADPSGTAAQQPPTGDSQRDGSAQGAGSPSQSPSNSSPSSNAAGEGGSGVGTASDSASSGGDVTTPVEAADLEYTKKATDMVLDYLNETRDAPDRELLEKLNWSENELRQFNERWQSLRQTAGDSPLGESREIQEALESLGMRPAGTASSQRQLQQDDLRGLRDTGNRQPPPPALRDAFDAFRRAATRQE